MLRTQHVQNEHSPCPQEADCPFLESDRWMDSAYVVVCVAWGSTWGGGTWGSPNHTFKTLQRFPRKKKKGSSWEPTPPRQIYRDLSEFGIKNTLCKGRPGNKITERNATRLAQRMFEKCARSDRQGRSSWATGALQAILRHWTGSYSVIGNNCLLNMDETWSETGLCKEYTYIPVLSLKAL